MKSHVSTAVLLAVVAFVSVGMTTWAVHDSPNPRNTDGTAYQRILHGMQSGDSYYAATREALVAKEGKAPSSVRAVRPPLLFVLLEPFPSSLWRYASALLIFGSLTATYALLREFDLWRRLAAMVLVGHWLVQAARYLPYHAEFWGLPFVLLALVAVQKQRWLVAISAVALAVAFRELYAVFIPLILLAAPKKQWSTMVIPLVMLAIYYAVHVTKTQDILDAHGYQPPLSGTQHIGPTITAVTFFLQPEWRLVGIISLLFGIVGLVEAARHRVEWRIAALAALVLALLTIMFGRLYWGVTFGPLVCMALATLPGYRNRKPWERTSDLRQ